MDNNNLIIAVILSILILAGFQYFYVKPQQEHYRQQVLAEKTAQPSTPGTPGTPSAPGTAFRDRAALIAENPRISIKTPELEGSVDLKGAKLDDVSLTQYRESVDPNSPDIVLLSPATSAPPHQAYYAEFSWLAGDPSIVVPNADTEWKADSKQLSPDAPLKLVWDNGHGLSFERTIAVDDHFMFTVTDSVSNKGPAPIVLYPFGRILRQGRSGGRASSVLHEGPLGVLDGTLDECTYNDMTGEEPGFIARFFTAITGGHECTKKVDSTGGWLGITDKYWLVALIPPQDEKLAAEFAYVPASAGDSATALFQTDFRGDGVTVAPGSVTQHATHFFVGAKRLSLFDQYADQLNIPHFDRAIDFGRFYFLTKPFLYLLNWLGPFFGNFGLAILAFTVMLKIVTLPLSVKSYRAMAKTKALQPELQRIQERFADDQMRKSVEMMELYKREKVNPTSGCLPMLIQIPIFFALYKVLYVDIEMRQAPFYGWIKDLSIPDPTSVFTAFGHIAWDPPAFLHIGVWPLIMGVSMFLQQRLSPQPPDKTQARVFMFLPLMFTFMLAQMPAGLVIYWTWSNLLSIAQQWFVMHHAGGSRK